jgi:hypothetical protein
MGIFPSAGAELERRSVGSHGWCSASGTKSGLCDRGPSSVA